LAHARAQLLLYCAQCQDLLAFLVKRLGDRLQFFERAAQLLQRFRR